MIYDSILDYITKGGIASASPRPLVPRAGARSGPPPRLRAKYTIRQINNTTTTNNNNSVHNNGTSNNNSNN